MVYPLLLMTLGTTTVLSTESQTFVQENNILEENTLYKKGNPKVEKEESPQSQTGKNTLDLLKSLNEILERLEKKISEDSKKVKNMLKNEVPLQCFGDIEDIASIVVFLASKRAKFVSGANWIVDGGQTRS